MFGVVGEMFLQHAYSWANAVHSSFFTVLFPWSITLLNLGLEWSLKLASLFVTLDRRGEVVILLLIMHLKGMNVPRGKCQVSIAQLYHSFYQSFPLTGLSLSAKTTKHLVFVSLIIIYLWGKGKGRHSSYQCSCSWRTYLPLTPFLESQLFAVSASPLN